jgi:hypothetical protein
MEGNVVTAAKWLGSSIVLASLILVGGMRWVLSSVERDRPARSTPVQAGQADPPPGELEELAKSFRGLGPDATATKPTSAPPPRPWFADQPSGRVAPLPAEGSTQP